MHTPPSHFFIATRPNATGSQLLIYIETTHQCNPNQLTQFTKQTKRQMELLNARQNMHNHIICLSCSATVWSPEMCKLCFAQTLLLCSWARPRMRTVRKYFYCTCCSEKSPDNVWWCIVHTADDKCQRRWMMENAYCTLHTAHCILHTAYYILHTAYCPLNTAQFGESFRKVFNIHIAYCNW